jgi:protein SCO1/2
MHAWILLAVGLLAASCRAPDAGVPGGTRTFAVRGTVRELKPDGRTVLIRHEAIPDFMAAMTMPFEVRSPRELAGLQPGDEVTFRLHVTGDDSWIDRVTRTGHTPPTATGTDPAAATPAAPPVGPAPRVNLVDRLAGFAFTNEFGRPLNFADYKGQALALTFFFTRCPIPEYCPRLSKNFEAATRKLQGLPGAPTNWHFFSITFDAENDTPGILRGYGRSYGYDSNRWTFVTSSQPVLDAVTQGLGFQFRKEGGTYDHSFITLVINAGGYRHAAWPIGGDTSDVLVSEITKAAATTTAPAPAPTAVPK